MKEVKLYGGIEQKVKSPSGYGDELAVTPDTAMTGTISEDKESDYELKLATEMFKGLTQDSYTPSHDRYHIDYIAIKRMHKQGLLDYDDEEGEYFYWLNDKGREEIKSPQDIIDDYMYSSDNSNNSEAPYLRGREEQMENIQEDLSGTTADMAAYDGVQAAKAKRVKKTPVAGFTYLGEDKISNLKKSIEQYKARKAKAERGSTEYKLTTKRIIDCEADLKRLEKEIVKEDIKSDVLIAGPKFLARPDHKEILAGVQNLLKGYGISLSKEPSISSQIAKRNPVFQKEIIKKLEDFNAKYGLTLKSLGLEENIKEGYDYPVEEINYQNKTNYDQLRQDIINMYDNIIDSGLDKELAVGQVAVKFRQDPEYVKALVESQIKKLNREVMIEKEIKAKKLLESYGIITKSKAPIAEDDDEESEKDEDGEKEDSKDDKDEKKSKGPKKGVNPFAKKDKKDDEEPSEESEEEETEEEEYEFTGAGSEICVKGLEREIAKGLAAKLLAPINDIIAPKGKYTITFEPLEEEESPLEEL